MNFQAERYTVLVYQITNPMKRGVDLGSVVARGHIYQQRGEELKKILEKYDLTPNSSESEVLAVVGVKGKADYGESAILRLAFDILEKNKEE